MSAKNIAKRMGIAVLAAAALTVTTAAAASAQGAGSADDPAYNAPDFVPIGHPVSSESTDSVFDPVFDPSTDQFQVPSVPQPEGTGWHYPTVPGQSVYVPPVVAPLLAGNRPSTSSQSTPSDSTPSDSTPSASDELPLSQFVPSQFAPSLPIQSVPNPASTGSVRPHWQVHTPFFGNGTTQDADE